jgi:hypothetical protein
MASLVSEDVTQRAHLFKGATAASSNTGQRIIGHHNRKPGFLHQSPIHVAEQSPAATDHHTAIADIRGEFWRRILKSLANDPHNLAQ